MHANPPKIHTSKSRLDHLFDGVAALLFVASIVYTMVSWGALPDQVPAHFNLAGEVDNYGSKWMLLLLPLIGIGMFAVLEFFERHPEWHNYPSRLNEDNGYRFYTASRTLLNRIKNLSVILFAQIQWDMVRVPLHNMETLSAWGTWIILGLIMIVPIILAVRMSKIT